MPLYAPNSTLPVITNTVQPPPQPQTAGSADLLTSVLATIIFIAIPILSAILAYGIFKSRREFRQDPIAKGLIKEIRRGKNDVVVVNIDVATRTAQIFLGEKLSPSVYAVRDKVTGEELLIPVTSESMVGIIQYGKISRPLILTVRKSHTIPFAIRLESLETSIPVSEYNTPEPELLAELAKVNKVLTGSITLSPSTKLVIAVDPKLLLSRKLVQELEIMSTIPTVVKEINQNMVKLIKLQNERLRQSQMGRMMMIMVIGVVVAMLIAVVFGSGAIKI